VERTAVIHRHLSAQLRGEKGRFVRAKDFSPRTKVCTKCGVEKPCTEFHKDKQKSDGLRPICKSCTNAKCLEYTRKNAEANRARVAAWQKANREHVRAEAAKWREKNAARLKQLNAAYRANNKERCVAHGANRRARVRGAEGQVSPDIIEKLLVLQRGMCPCCKKPLGKDFHLDHIIPLIEGGTNKDSNMQLLRAKCNLQKNKKHPVEFMQERGFLL
jgi:hypothetical protein